MPDRATRVRRNARALGAGIDAVPCHRCQQLTLTQGDPDSATCSDCAASS